MEVSCDGVDDSNLCDCCSWCTLYLGYVFLREVCMKEIPTGPMQVESGEVGFYFSPRQHQAFIKLLEEMQSTCCQEQTRIQTALETLKSAKDFTVVSDYSVRIQA